MDPRMNRALSPRKRLIDWAEVKEELREELEETMAAELERARTVIHAEDPEDPSLDFEKQKLGAKAYGVMSQAWSQVHAARLDFEATEKQIKQALENERLQRRAWDRRVALLSDDQKNI